MANNETVPSQSTQSSDAVADTIEADNVLTLAEKRKLAEKYLMTTLCSSREFDFMAMCDDQSQPFWCDINDPSQTTQSGHVVDTVEPQDDIATIEADNVLTLAEKRKLAENYLMARLCSSREFDFMAMCDDQSHMPFWCD